MYAVEAFFSAELEEAVKKIWHSLSDTGLDSSMISIQGLRPHITLATYSTLPVEDFKRLFDTFRQSFEPVNATFITLGAFPTTGTCFLAPIVTEQLIGLHKHYHETFSKFQEAAHFYYLPGNWSPHCTLAIGLDNKRLIDVFAHCLKKFSGLSGTIDEIGLVALDYENNRCVSSRRVL